MITRTLIASVRSEWLKQKRSFTLWLAIGGGFFVPALILAIRLVRPAGLRELYASAGFWERLWTQCWESMAVFIMPLVIILGASLIAQIEYRNNTWKQVHATPQPFAAIYMAKLLVLLTMPLQLLLWFNVAMFAAGIVPALVFSRVDAPVSPIPLASFLRGNAAFYVDALPIVGLQYLLALRFRNFMVPLGVGIAVWIAAIGALPWEYNYVLPYAYTVIDYTTTVQSRVAHALPAAAPVLATGYFMLFAVAGYVMYATRGDKG
jgi:lantibiotic transport system permease protein